MKPKLVDWKDTSMQPFQRQFREISVDSNENGSFICCEWP